MHLEFAGRSDLRRLGLVLGALLASGCGEDSTGPRPIPVSMTAAGGEGQQGTVAQPLDSVLRVFVTDKFGQPVPGVLVRFAVPGRAGSLTPITQTTGPAGRASARWTLAATMGAHSATATASGLDSVVFHAVATPAAPASLALVTGDLQAEVATARATAVVVLVRDGFGNPVGGAPVTFAPAAGSGTAVPAATRSDSAGHAATSWTLGDAPGLQVLAARVDSLPQLRVQLRALSRPGQRGGDFPLYSSGERWTGDSQGAPEGESSPGRRNPGPVPALHCWHNALGPVALPGAFGPEEQATAMASEGVGSDCEEPAPRW